MKFSLLLTLFSTSLGTLQAWVQFRQSYGVLPHSAAAFPHQILATRNF